MRGVPITGFAGRLGFAISPRPSPFAPLLFAGRLEEGLKVAADLGFSAVELSLRAPSDVQPEHLASMLEDRRLRLCAIATGQACLVDSLCLSSSDPDIREAAAGRLCGAIDLASRFGAAVIVGGIRGRLVGPPGEQASQRAGAVEAIRGCAVHAAERGVTLLLEPINRYETNFVNTAAQGLAVLDEIAHPSMKLLLDTFHMNIEEPSLEEAVLAAGDRLGYVHVADSNRRAPGQGHTDFAGLVSALGKIAYEGMLVAEILPLPEDAEAARLTAAFWEQIAVGQQQAAAEDGRP